MQSADEVRIAVLLGLSMDGPAAYLQALDIRGPERVFTPSFPAVGLMRR